jgi:hypothetical protein
MSTTIYELIVDSDSFATLEAIDEADSDLFIDGFDGTPMAETWRAPPVRFAPPRTHDGALKPDFASLFGAVPILSRKAVNALGEVLGSHGELLPLRLDDGYWAFNVLSTIDLLDEQRSSGDWFAPGRLVTLRRLVARTPILEVLPPIFKLPQWRKGRALLTQSFLDAAHQHGLSGLDARPVGTV